MVLFPDSPFLNDVIALLIILLAFMLVLKLIKNSDRLILTLIGILMGVIIAKYFPLFVEILVFVDKRRRTNHIKLNLEPPDLKNRLVDNSNRLQTKMRRSKVAVR